MVKLLLKQQQASSKATKKGSSQKKVKFIQKKITTTEIRVHLNEKISQKRKVANVHQINKRTENKFKAQLKKNIDIQQCTCPVCFQIIVGPILTECGHIFCLRCIEEASSLNEQCPICRKFLQNQTFKISNHIKMLIRQYIKQNLSLEEQKIYEEKTYILQEAQRKRSLPQCLKKNDLVDYNYNKKWIQVKVLQIYNTFIVVEIPSKKGCSKKQKAFLRQRKLAHHRTFTKGTPSKQTQFHHHFIIKSQEPSPIVQPRENQSTRILNNVNQRNYISRWDEFEVIPMNNGNWINQEADINIQGNIDIWSPSLEENDLSLFQ